MLSRRTHFTSNVLGCLFFSIGVIGWAGCAGGSTGGAGGESLGLGGSEATSTPPTSTHQAATGTGGASSSSDHTTTTSDKSTSSSGGGGAGGAGGASTSNGGSGGSGGVGGSGGAGGATTTSAGGGGSGGGVTTHGLVFVATGATETVTGVFDIGATTWTTTPFAEGSNDTGGVAFGASGSACAVIHSVTGDKVRFTISNGSSWNALADLGPSITTLTAPHMASGVGVEDLVYVGTNDEMFFARRASQWSPFNELVAVAGNPTMVNVPPAMAETARSVVLAFAGTDGDLYDQERLSGTWQAASAHALGAGAVAATPAVTALSVGSGDLMIVYNQNATSPGDLLKYTIRTGSSWSLPAAIDTQTAFTPYPVNAATLANGDVIVVYRGENSEAYWTRFTTGAATPAWSTPAPIDADNTVVLSTPAVAPGVGDADAEVAYVDQATGAVTHARLRGNAFTTTVVGGSGLVSVALASE